MARGQLIGVLPLGIHNHFARQLKVPLDLTKVCQGILLFFVLGCDSLITYRIRLLRTVEKSADA